MSGGTAKTAQFLLTTATLMLGTTADVFELQPSTHSLGLVKNVRATTDPRFTELMQGVGNQVVYSVNTEMNSTIQAEVYEFTARNLAYAAGLDGAAAGFATMATVEAISSAVTAVSTAVIVAGTGNLSGWAAGDWGILQNAMTEEMWAFKVGTVDAADRELNIAAGWTPPDNVTWATTTTRLLKVNALKIGTEDTNRTWGVKIIGTLPESGEPVQMVFPKVKITKGLDLAFQQDNFANMPFEFRPYNLLPSDPFYSEFGANKHGMVLRR